MFKYPVSRQVFGEELYSMARLPSRGAHHGLTFSSVMSVGTFGEPKANSFSLLIIHGMLLCLADLFLANPSPQLLVASQALSSLMGLSSAL